MDNFLVGMACVFISVVTFACIFVFVGGKDPDKSWRESRQVLCVNAKKKIDAAPDGAPVYVTESEYRAIMSWMEEERCQIVPTDDGKGQKLFGHPVYPESQFAVWKQDAGLGGTGL